jgi:hypothetical protein
MENRSYVTTGENRIFLPHTDRMPRLEAVRLSSQQAIHPARYRTSIMWVLRENLIFSPLSTYSLIPRVTRNTLKPHNLDYNLHAT